MHLDLATFTLFMVVLLLTVASLFAVIALRYQQQAGPGWWLAGCLALASGYGVRWWHSAGNPVDSFWWAGLLYLAGNLAFWSGIYRFCGLPGRRRLLALWIAYALLWLLAARAPYSQQLSWVMVLAGLPNLLVFEHLRRARDLVEPVLRQFVATVFLVSGVVLCLRGLLPELLGGSAWADVLQRLGAMGSLASSALILLRLFALLVLLHARQEQVLRNMAQTDALTGLLNRKGFFDQAQRLLARHRTSGAPSAVLMLDIDHFKRINDNYGHAAGDAVLAAFGERLRASVRPEDCVGRLGGEEFAALLLNLPSERAEQVADRLREQWQNQCIRFNDQAVKATVSIGVCAFLPSAHINLEDMLQQADQALYRAKGAGRNRQVLVGSNLAQPPTDAQ